MVLMAIDGLWLKQFCIGLHGNSPNLGTKDGRYLFCLETPTMFMGTQGFEDSLYPINHNVLYSCFTFLLRHTRNEGQFKSDPVNSSLSIPELCGCLSILTKGTRRRKRKTKSKQARLAQNTQNIFYTPASDFSNYLLLQMASTSHSLCWLCNNNKESSLYRLRIVKSSWVGSIPASPFSSG